MILLTVALATVLTALLAPAATADIQPLSSERGQQAGQRALAKQIGKLRASTWECQDTLGVPRTKASESIWSLPISMPYRHWAANLWRKRERGCERKLSQRTIPANWDWLTSVRLVQRVYPGTEGWLKTISSREGGWGRFVMNSQGSGCGGWMQFMSSTYWAYSHAAFADLRSKGFIVPQSANSWSHPMGQAITAGYMRYVGLDGHHWAATDY
jgi:hypothetical protein